MEGLEERIVRVVLATLREGQGIVQPGIPLLSEETPPYISP